MKAFTARIQGSVQGVGYRFFAEKAALERGVRGWVRNSMDGSVEVMAVGAESDLTLFLKDLKKGPLTARVESIDADWLKDVPHFRDFSIQG